MRAAKSLSTQPSRHRPRHMILKMTLITVAANREGVHDPWAFVVGAEAVEAALAPS